MGGSARRLRLCWSGSRGFRVVRCMSRSRRARAGCLSLGRSSAPALSRTWPRPSRRARSGVASGVRRPTVRTRCGSELPEAWIAPEHIRQWRSRLHLRKALIDERTQWLLRIRSTLYHHGVSAGAPAQIASATGREFLAALDLPADALERIEVALFMVDTLGARIHELELGLRRIARHQAGCQALMTQYGVGELIALVTLTELGDVTRMSSSRKAVRFAGIDIGVHRSDRTSRVGKLTAKAHPPCAGRYMKPRNPQPGRPAPTTRTTTR